MGHDEPDVDAVGEQHRQATAAHVVVGEDDRGAHASCGASCEGRAVLAEASSRSRTAWIRKRGRCRTCS